MMPLFLLVGFHCVSAVPRVAALGAVFFIYSFEGKTGAFLNFSISKRSSEYCNTLA